MTSDNVYKRQAEFNEQEAITAQNNCPDWAVIMFFYAALHWINHYAYENNELEALFEKERKSNDSMHKIKRDYVVQIAKNNNFKDLEKAYKYLFNASMTARYLENLDEDITAREYYLRNKAEVSQCFRYLQDIKKKLS